MSTDEQQIRDLIAGWMAASQARDVDKVLSLITDDVVFLVPGRVMRKADFAAAARGQASPDGPDIRGESEVEELEVLGNWAYVRTRLRVVMTPRGGKPMERAGHTLTILRKEGGRWLLARDANLLVPTDG